MHTDLELCQCVILAACPQPHSEHGGGRSTTPCSCPPGKGRGAHGEAQEGHVQPEGAQQLHAQAGAGSWQRACMVRADIWGPALDAQGSAEVAPEAAKRKEVTSTQHS